MHRLKTRDSLSPYLFFICEGLFSLIRHVSPEISGLIDGGNKNGIKMLFNSYFIKEL